ncbi:VOC family protein [Rhizobium sp. EC-SD404]|uniref:VOC family protein n=1 Tax=Rhizobium sp. EC-SD404 TaxID=2038389 RepID=UPI00125380A5|nr:VOC family protein [Rhizobium sp. EC-SD404]VVT07051.1 Dioxygenase [Rhizobium sp. EC-SD404]
MAGPFHLAFPIRDIEETRSFYRDVLGCAIGRESETWIDFDLFGHQMSGHVRPSARDTGAEGSGTVDGKAVPIPHFGAVLTMDEWRALAERLKDADGIDWILEPQIRFEGQPGEQATLFIRDPSGNALEFKGFADMDAVFAA